MDQPLHLPSRTSVQDPPKSPTIHPSTVYYRGTCACTRITYTSHTPPMDVTFCHCTTCRRLSGNAGQIFVHAAPASQVIFSDATSGTRSTGLPHLDDDDNDDDNDDHNVASKKTMGIVYRRFSASGVGERAFCESCFTPLAMRYRFKPDAVGLCVGTVVDGSWRDDGVREAMRVAVHIFTSQKAWWVEPEKDDGVRCWERFSPEFEERLESWEREHGEEGPGAGGE
ncbi:MAG: hypothetical protein Q9227_002673 [Pyrenula ochraceoflavens]